MNIPEGATHFKIVEGETFFFKLLETKWGYSKISQSFLVFKNGEWETIPIEFEERKGHILPKMIEWI